MSSYGDMPPWRPRCCWWASAWCWGSTSGSSAWVWRWCGGPPAARAWRSPPRRSSGPALELAAARITSVPWDQLGYSQVDNALVNQLAPWTGVYGISFVLVAVNALLTGGLMLESRPHIGHRNRTILRATGVLLIGGGLRQALRSRLHRPATTATAVLIQPNLDVSADNRWPGPASGTGISPSSPSLAGEQCKTYIAGIPQTGAPSGRNRLPALSHASRPGRLAGVARAVLRGATRASSRPWPPSPARARRRWWWATSASDFSADDRRLARLQLRPGRRRGRRARGPLRQNPPGPLRRVHSLSELCSSLPTSSPAGFRRSRAATSARSSLPATEPSLRRLHLL